MKEQLSESGEVIPIGKCSVCGYEFDCASNLEDESRPRPGDVTLCLKCGEVYQFGPKMALAPILLDSLLKLDVKQHDLIKRAQAEIRKNRFLK